MKADKSAALARRLEILAQARRAPVVEECIAGWPTDNPDLQRLLKDGHIKLVGTPLGRVKMPARFEITPRGEVFRINHLSKSELRAEEHQRFDRGIFARPHFNYRNFLAEYQSRDRASATDKDLARTSAETARLISEALREAEADPFVLDTGWIDADEAARHYLWKMLKNDRAPNDGFTLYDRLPRARTVQIKKRLDGDYRSTFDLMVVRTLGGGAAVCHVQSNELIQQQAIHDRMFKEFMEQRKKNPDLIEPVYPKLVPAHRLILLSSGEGMNTYLQMAFR